MNLKADTEYIFKTGNTISYDGTIPLKQMQEIVRCKDCKHRGTDDCPMHYKGVHANEDFLKKVDNDFCSYGERNLGWYARVEN